MYVEGGKRDSKYNVMTVCYVCQRCQKKLKIHCQDCNDMYVKDVKRDSKYTIRTHNIFAHNFLNIQLIYNPKHVLESWDPGLSNDIIKCYLFLSMLNVLKVGISFDLAFESQLCKTFLGLKIS